MLDYLSLQGSSENPTFITILFTVLLAFLLSSLIAYTYDKTTEQVTIPVGFLQAIILAAIVAATVMQAIGDSLARGLGMLGALAIIRFRTNLRAPRNMVFTFASLAAGIACGVYGFTIGVVGTIAFCVFAFILRFSPLHFSTTTLTGVLKFDLPKSSEELLDVEMILKRFCKKHAQIRFQISKPKVKENKVPLPEKLLSYEYHLKLKKESDAILLDSAIAELATIRSVKINFENIGENV
jgi:uncharacterized membrane protein YhiD involved in acid resistance